MALIRTVILDIKMKFNGNLAQEAWYIWMLCVSWVWFKKAMDQMHVKMVAPVNEPMENYHPTLVPLNSAELYKVFPLLIFVFRPANVLILCFYFILL